MIAEKKRLDILLEEVFGRVMFGKLLDMAAYVIINEENKMTYLEDYGYYHSLLN